MDSILVRRMLVGTLRALFTVEINLAQTIDLKLHSVP